MGILIKGMDEIPEDGAVLVVKHDNGKAYIKHACTYGYSMELVKLPAVQSDHVADISKKAEKEDCISRRAAIDAIEHRLAEPAYQHTGEDWYVGMNCAENEIYELPSVQPERDIPIKPYEATDTAWGIPNRQAVYPKCDYYLGHVAFLGDYKDKKVTYCETCGQAIDWEGWDFE